MEKAHRLESANRQLTFTVHPTDLNADFGTIQAALKCPLRGIAMRSTRIWRCMYAVAIVLVFLSVDVWADTFTVPTGFPTIQEAIDATVDGDCINVEPGIYFETIDFLDRAITVVSTEGADVTIINAGCVAPCPTSGNDSPSSPPSQRKRR